ncbi:uncharacterized protein LOC135377646 [Ornithodoros turicata]|uniref:uncharacterized protein LOC135377646 n=1 Tax=Ornithodoros turicata TaxID=34597 RepID=UPI0031390620
MDRVKQKRGVLRAAITKLINEIDLLLQTTAPAADVLSTKLDILKSKEEMLQTLDQNIEESVPEEVFEQEVQGVLSYEEKICTAKSQITQKLRTYNRQLPRTDSSPSRVPHVQPTQNAAACRVRLPKIEISKFSGDLAEWTTFWDQFQSSIHTNESLHKVDKFRYLQSYLTGKAAAAISGLSLTNENYDTAIDLLKQRFNQRHLIVEEHLNRLLHLPPVVDAGKFVRLRELYDEVQVRVRSLQALDVGTKEYGIMLMSVLRKAVPREVTLEYNRKHKGAPSEGRTEVEDFMDFLKVEVESREKDTLLPDMQRNRAMNLDEPHSRTAPRDGRRLFERQTTGALTTGVTPQQLECLLCKAADHGIENCRSNLSVGDKKALLSREGRCFKCGKKYHRSRDCRTAPRLRCATCGGHHFTILCDRPGNYRAAEDPNPARLGVMASSALSTSDAAAATGPVLLQTARIWAETDRKRQFVRAMLDGGSQRTFIKESLSHELQCEPVGEEALSIFSFGCTPLKKTCRRVKVWLRSQYRRQDTCVEALETPEISANLMPSPDANVTRVLNEKGMEVADAAVFGTTCKPEVQILIGSDYYWAVVTGESQRISEKLFAVNTIFGWTVQGPNTSSSSCFNTGVGVLRVTVESTDTDMDHTMVHMEPYYDRHGAILWSDSMIALSWIRGDAQRYKPFVANRISEIQSSRSISGWRHCPGEQNPADLLTRGSSIHSLHSRTHWWEGPQWLKESQEQWPSATTGVGKDISEEVRATHVLLLPSPPTEPILQLTNCSSLDNVVRTTAWIYRFLHNSRRDEPATGPLSTCEIRRAENYWIRQVQAESFSEELEAVKSSWHLKVTSKLRDLHPYLDKDGILRITGRLQRGEESEEVKHPIVLPKDHRFTQLLIVRAHRRLLHSGVRDTLVELRELYWIIQARQAVKKELYKCHRCRRQRARPAFLETAPLPPDRITRAEPFEVTGVDFAGPLFYKAPDVNSKKCYIALFTCAVTRAVHLEIVDDLTTQRFLMAFRRLWPEEDCVKSFIPTMR